MLQTIACMIQASLFIGSGLSKVTEPAKTAAIIKKTDFPEIFDKVTGGAVKLDYVLFTQVLGGALIFFGICLAFGIMRRFAALVLALLTVCFTAFVHVNLKDITKTDEGNMIHALKNVAIIGGLLVVAFAPRRRSGEAKAAAANAAANGKQKRN